MAAKISLAKWNDKGAVASITSGMDTVDITLHRESCNPEAVCKEAAKRLRELACHFERLAEMDEPFKQKTQNKAST